MNTTLNTLVLLQIYIYLVFKKYIPNQVILTSTSDKKALQNGLVSTEENVGLDETLHKTNWGGLNNDNEDEDGGDDDNSRENSIVSRQPRLGEVGRPIKEGVPEPRGSGFKLDYDSISAGNVITHSLHLFIAALGHHKAFPLALKELLILVGCCQTVFKQSSTNVTPRPASLCVFRLSVETSLISVGGDFTNENPCPALV